MPASFEIGIHPLALQGIEEAVAYISEHHSPEKAAEWADKLFDAIEKWKVGR